MNSQRITGYFKKIAGYGILIIVILMFSSFFQNLKKVIAIRREVIREKEKIEAFEKENRELERKVRETQGNEFIEKQIRDKLGLVKQGEIVVVLPDEEIVRSLAPKIRDEESALPDPNWEKWLKLFINN